MDRARRLGEEKIAPLLLKFAAPAIVGLMAQALYFTIDRIFVGRAIMRTPSPSLTVAFPFMLLLMALGMLVGFGAGRLISIRLGEKRKPEAEQVLGNATVLLLVAAVVSTLVGLALPGSPAAAVRRHAAMPALRPATTCASSCWVRSSRSWASD